MRTGAVLPPLRRPCRSGRRRATNPGRGPRNTGHFTGDGAPATARVEAAVPGSPNPCGPGGPFGRLDTGLPILELSAAKERRAEGVRTWRRCVQVHAAVEGGDPCFDPTHS